MAGSPPSVAVPLHWRAPRAGWRDYLDLTRPRVTLVVTLTGGPALALGGGGPAAPTSLGVLAALALLGAGCSALNAWIERDRDALMARTRCRPLPERRIAPSAALAFGGATSAAGIGLLGLFGNATAAMLGFITLALYLGPYTVWAKPRTAWSAVVGAAPGAAAPLIADAAAHGHVGPWGWVLFAIVFLWQPPHVWSIELFRSQDHAEAGLPAMPALIGADMTRQLILIWVAVLLPVTALPLLADGPGLPYAAAVLGAGLYFARAAIVAMRTPSPRADRDTFLASLVHMTLLFGVLLVALALR